MEKSCNINELSMISGFTTRTLRNYIKKGTLQGDIQSGIWVFTENQISAFLESPGVQKKMMQKNAAIATDFLQHPNLKGNRLCIILDMAAAEAKKKKAASFFCDAVVQSEGDVRFSSQKYGNRIRVVVEGAEGTVVKIMRRYYHV